MRYRRDRQRRHRSVHHLWHVRCWCRPVGVLAPLRHSGEPMVEELTVEAPFDRRPYDDALHPSRGFQIEELPTHTVKEVMTPFLITIEEDTPIREVAARMAKFGIHRVIVLDDDQQIRGIVSSIDVLRWVAEEGVDR